ncbi:MAG TPA: transglycosylase SLT domain-containing protein [Gemmatimonadaceae bacterium]|nr:transglycosylase SLT domain-containing protein [Gemmatimonadaceae bacterium]
MALGGGVSFLVLLVMSAACSKVSEGDSDNSGTLAASLIKNVNQDSTSTPEKALVLRARALDRADSLDQAKSLYVDAAKRIPDIADWLYLRAAGVARDKSERDGFLSRVKSPVAEARKPFTEAIAIERSGDVESAINAYEAAGDRLAVLRLQLLRMSDTPRVTAARRGLIAYLGGDPGRDTVRDAIALFDKVFSTQANAAEHLTIARAAYDAGIASRAVSGFTRAFAGGLGTAVDHFHMGLMLSRLNRDNEAIAQFNRVTQPENLAAGAKYQAARALLALGKREAARSLLRQITLAFPKDTSAASALLLLSDLATDDGRDSDARATMMSLVQRFPNSRQAPQALFRAGLVAYISKDYKTASRELDSLVAKYPQSDDALAAGYWSGRAWRARGDAGESNKRWKAVLAKEKGSYYSVLSARRLDEPLLTDKSANAYPSVPDVEAASKRIALLKEFGMETEAKFEYDRLFRDAEQSKERLVATAHALSGTDQSSRSIALGRKAVNEVGATAPNYRLMYPVLERATLSESAKKYNLEPALVASLIRQESNFNPRATSPVGARGLMQLMPPVGRTIAKGQGIPNYTDESLYDPAINIKLGTQHLSGLFRKTPQIERVLAAYNAGESRVAKWIQKAGADDPEVFTERIPFVETRDYVRAIVRNRAFYSSLYSW